MVSCKIASREKYYITVPLDKGMVEGNITFLCPSDISVEITHPYQNVKSGMHIPYFAMHLKEIHFADANNIITEKGMKRALDLLSDLYINCRYFEENKDKLKKVYGEKGQNGLWEFIDDDFGIIGIDSFEDLIKKYLKG